MSIGYSGETNSRIIHIVQPEIENADSYKLRFTYTDNTTYDVPIEDEKIIITNSMLQITGEVKCQWIAASTENNIIAKSEVFSLIVEDSLPNGVAVPPPEYSSDIWEKCKNEVTNCQAEVDNCKNEVINCQAEVDNCKNEVTNCQAEVNKCKDEVANCQKEVDNCKTEVLNCKNEVANAQSFAQQAQNATANIAVNSANIAQNTANITTNTNNIAKNTTDIRNCHFYYSTVASPANIDTVNHKITIEILVVMTMISGSIWIDNVDLSYDPTWWIACVYFDYDETEPSKMLKICQHSDLPKKNIDVIMSFPARDPEFAKYTHAKFSFTVNRKQI